MSLPFQIIAIFFALFMLYTVHVYRRKLSLSFIEVQFWHVLWLGFVFLTLYPETLSTTVERLNFARVFDLLIVIAFMILTTIIVLSFFQVRSLNKKVEDIIRETAIKNVKSRK